MQTGASIRDALLVSAAGSADSRGLGGCPLARPAIVTITANAGIHADDLIGAPLAITGNVFICIGQSVGELASFSANALAMRASRPADSVFFTLSFLFHRETAGNECLRMQRSHAAA